MTDSGHSPVSVRLMAGVIVCLSIGMAVLLWEANTLIVEFGRYIAEGSHLVDLASADPDSAETSVTLDGFQEMTRRRQARFMSVMLLTLLTIVFTFLGYFIWRARRVATIRVPEPMGEGHDMDIREDYSPLYHNAHAEIFDDEETGLSLPDDLDDEEFLADGGEGGADLVDEGQPVLADSYNKMVDALRKVADLEKKHSAELADANRKLEVEITERNRAEKEIRRLSRQLISGIEEAQKNLAQDLHDEFGQTLAALHMGLEALEQALPPEIAGEHGDRLNRLVHLIEQLGDKIRSISSDLRPDLLDDMGLVPTLEWYLVEFKEQHPEFQVEFQAVGFKKRLSPEQELVLYRIFQESLNNVVKHSKARRVRLTLTYSFPKVILMVRDDGIGFNVRERSSGIGLIGMRERAVSLNGTIDIRSEPGKGSAIRVELPVS